MAAGPFDIEALRTEIASGASAEGVLDVIVAGLSPAAGGDLQLAEFRREALAHKAAIRTLAQRRRRGIGTEADDQRMYAITAAVLELLDDIERTARVPVTPLPPSASGASLHAPSRGGGALHAPAAARGPSPARTTLALSYRRLDMPGMAGRIRDKLAARYGDDAVFMDIDSIPYGIDFREHLQRVFSQIDIVLAVVGPGWRGPKADGTWRIDDPNDFVRIEIEAALARGIPLVPLLIGGTPMPGEADLPASMAAFAHRNAAIVDTGMDFHVHMDRLIKRLDRMRRP
jgi:hypothetical protein